MNKEYDNSRRKVLRAITAIGVIASGVNSVLSSYHQTTKPNYTFQLSLPNL